MIDQRADEDFLAGHRPLPARAAGALLPDARLGARRRGPGAGDLPARLALLPRLRGPVLAAHLALPDRHQRLPHRAGQPQPAPAADRAGRPQLRPGGPADLRAARCSGSSRCRTRWSARSSDPATVVTDRASVRLALIAALQHLPPRQRAVLVLRDVLRLRAAEVAEMLDTSVAAVNSSLQRARAQLDQAGLTEDDVVEPTDPAQRALLDRYARALEAKDIPAIVAAFTSDAVWEMPPFVSWYQGAGGHRPADRHQLPGRPGRAADGARPRPTASPRSRCTSSTGRAAGRRSSCR